MQTAIAYLRHQLEKSGHEINVWKQNLAESEKAVIKCRSNLRRAQQERIDLGASIRVLEDSLGEPVRTDPQDQPE